MLLSRQTYLISHVTAGASAAAMVSGIAFLVWVVTALVWLAVGIGIVGTILGWWLGSAALRRRWAAQTRSTTATEADTLEAVTYFQHLAPAEQERFAALVRVFLAETPIIGVGEHIDERLRVLVAAGAVIPIFGFRRWEYQSLNKVLIRPNAFTGALPQVGAPAGQINDQTPQALGMVTVAEGIMDGLVLFSRQAIEEGFAIHGDKHNVVIHEFAHLVDRANGGINGFPAGLQPKDYPIWDALIHEELDKKFRKSDIPAYGFTNREEFFAVCSEYFFENPAKLKKHHPNLYRMLSDIYCQQPKRRFEGVTKRMLKRSLTQLRLGPLKSVA